MLSPPRLHYRSVTRVWRCQRAANAGRAQFFIRPKKPSEAPLAPICVPVAKLELSENMEFARPPSISPPGAQHASRSGRRRVGDLQIASRTPCGELALRLQLGILHRSVKWPKLNPADRLFGGMAVRGFWDDWRSALVIVKPDTLIAWHRKGFSLFWTWKVRHGQPGRPAVAKDVRELIRGLSRGNPVTRPPVTRPPVTRPP
jgi:hypothetical protein